MVYENHVMQLCEIVLEAGSTMGASTEIAPQPLQEAILGFVVF